MRFHLEQGGNLFLAIIFFNSNSSPSINDRITICTKNNNNMLCTEWGISTATNLHTEKTSNFAHEVGTGFGEQFFLFLFSGMVNVTKQ